MSSDKRGTVILLMISAAPILLPRAGLPALASPPFAAGERLTYSITWSAFEAGEVTATLQRTANDPHDDFEVVTTARSHGFVSLLYNLNDEFRSRFNPDTACSEGISKQVAEGRRHKRTDITFDTARKLAILDEHNLAKPSEPPKHAEEAIPACVQDVVSAFYYLRSRPMQVGDRIPVPVNDGSKTRDVIVEVQAREEVDSPVGRRFAFRVEPTVFGSLYNRKGRMLIWFSDDAQRLPLRIKAVISVGAITGTLESVTNVPATVELLSPRELPVLAGAGNRTSQTLSYGSLAAPTKVRTSNEDPVISTVTAPSTAVSKMRTPAS
jgi:hypothetical protein